MSYAFTCLVALIAILAGCTDPQLAPLSKSILADKPEVISLEITNYTPTAGRTLRHLFVSNFSVRVNRGTLEYSTAREGLSDVLKSRLASAYNFLPKLPDSNNDGFSDLVMYMGGVTYRNQSTLTCNPTQRVSSSNDMFLYRDKRLVGAPNEALGLNNCEKSFLQLNSSKFDYDGDGIPDYLELRNGLNPKNPNDANLIMAVDGIPNIDKVKQNIPIDESADLQPYKIFAYKYNTDFDDSGARTFRVSNIPVLNGGVGNFIAIYLIETDQSTRQDSLYTAYLILDAPSGGKNFKFRFWRGEPNAGDTNQEISIQ